MTDQKADQAALNGLVDDCYPDGWPWQEGDRYINFRTDIPIQSRTGMVRLNKTVMLEGDSPLAGTWVEGRLREMMGEAFKVLIIYADDDPPTWGCFIKLSGEAKDYGGPTPITALVATLRVLKQKEVKE